MTTLNFTGNIRRLRVQPGDTIVIEASRPITKEQAQMLMAQMKEVYPDNKCIVMAENIRVTKVLK